MDEEELSIIQALDTTINQESTRILIDSIVQRVEQRLSQDAGALLVWEPIPLARYSLKLPNMIGSSWVFVLRAQANTGAERHPNSHQRMMSYRGSGNLQIWSGDSWHSNYLVSDLDTEMESRWMSIPANTWHRTVVAEENWVVVSFHTAAEDELIEERPDATNARLIHQRRYLNNTLP